ncbi:MAG: acyl-CoA dehydrogenase family protein [Chloroflexi bacterium]|nr:acyl-CoA dehydrogenase family protein [Chloroflexota bacterium]
MPDTTAPDFVAAAAALAPHILAARDELESARRIPPALVEKLDQAGLFQLSLPRSMGGPETDPITSFRAIEELSKADGAVGWCAMLSTSNSLLMGWLRADVGRSLFGQPPDFRMAGSIRPEGRAISVDGGYRVDGRWDYASGIDHANWLLCTCKVEDKNGPRLTPAGAPETRIMLVPIGAVTVHDTWFVVGMSGTGSKDFVVDDVFVPMERTFSLSEPPQEAGPLYHPRLSLVAIWAVTAANLLGMARGAMDCFVELATKAGSTMSSTRLRDRPLVQTKVAEAEAKIGAARAYVLDAVGTAWQAVCDEVPDPSSEIAQARLAIAHAMRESVEAVDLLFHAAGTNAIHRKYPLERFFRDIHVAVQHVAALPSNFESAGQVLLGLRPSDPGW